jgi:ring-1,2-phenylacetyl-CoA epoxidase subunit PaaE
MVKQALKVDGNKVVLYYGNKAENSTFFYRELIALKNAYPNNFQLELLFSREQVAGANPGRIDRDLLVKSLKHELNLSFEPDFYMCGPSAMMQTIEDTLKSYRVSESKIHLEYFETNALNEGGDDLGEEFEVNYSVTLDDETESFTASSKINALDAAIEAGMDAPFSCKGGVCSSCIAKVEKGKMEMVINHVLTDGEVEEGLVLTCQSHAKTKEVHLNFDV